MAEEKQPEPPKGETLLEIGGVVNLPETCRCSGAFSGALMIVFAGRMAWPTSLASNCLSSAEAAVVRAMTATAERRERRIGNPFHGGIERPGSYGCSMSVG